MISTTVLASSIVDQDLSYCQT